MIVIVGAGIIGMFIALKLLERGEEVRILDTSDIKANATQASVGMLAPLIEAKPQEKELFNLMLDSKNIWKNFEDHFKISNLEIGLKNNSSLLIASNEDDLERIKFKKNFFSTLGFESRLLNFKETNEIEPELNSNFIGSLFCKDQNQVDPIRLRKTLIKKILSMGCEIKKIKKLSKIKIKNDSFYFDEKKIVAKKVVISCGVWSRELLKKSFNISFPLRPLKGVSIILDAGRKLFNNNLWFRNIYVAQRNNNILAIGATEDERGYDESIKIDEVYFLTKHIWDSFPGVENLKLIDIKSGLRPTISDGYPVIGPIESISSDIICAFGHFRHGILLAPITAEIVLKHIYGSRRKKTENFFSPKRFNL